MSQRVTKRLRKRWVLSGLAGLAVLSSALGGNDQHRALRPQVLHARVPWRPAYAPLTLLPVKTTVSAAAFPKARQITAPPDPDTTYLKAVHRYADTITPGPKIVTYTVQAGDTLWSIAGAYQTDISTLIALNPDVEPERLRPGTDLKVISDFRGIVYRVQEGDTLQRISAAYLSPLEQIMQVNQLTDPSDLKTGDLLFLPGGRPRYQVASRGARERSPAPASDAKPKAAAPAPAGARAGFIWPINGGDISSEYGYRADMGDFHTGIDIAVPYGTPAGAAAAGTVTFAGWDGNYGYCVVIDHGGGIKTKYAHGSAILVAVGQQVAQGQAVIKVGHTGRATGDHLHLEFIVNGKTVNPRNYLAGR